jgi:hypothetical protein
MLPFAEHLSGQYTLSPAASMCLLGASAILEFPSMIENGGFDIILSHPWHFLVASTMGVAINFLSFYVIQVTSGLTMKVSKLE